MRRLIVGVHLQREDVEPIAEAIPARGLFLSGVPAADEQPLADRDLLIRVAAIRAALLERATFIAIRYGFAVTGAEEAEAKCAGRADAWRARLVAHRGEVEMTLKAGAAAPADRPDRREFSKGADYLRALRDAAHHIEVDPAFRVALERELIPLAARSRWSRDAASLELALLVRRDAVDAVNAAGERLRASFPAVPFLLSGPWPLEVFADDDHE